jgi:hypothetical protein
VRQQQENAPTQGGVLAPSTDTTPRTQPAAPLVPGAPDDAGAEGNARLTGILAAVLLVVLAVEGLTIPAVRQLFGWHVFFGVVLIPVVLVKTASTSYRMVRYYTGEPAYRRKGPPSPLLRALGPVVVLTTLTVLATGVALLVFGPSAQWARGLHKASFIAFFFATAVHVLAHLRRVPGLTTADLDATRRLPHAGQRWVTAAASLVVGLGLGFVALRYDATWLHFFATQHRHDG